VKIGLCSLIDFENKWWFNDMIIARRFWVEDMGLFPLKREAGLDM
jgi:hypothetical protein